MSPSMAGRAPSFASERKTDVRVLLIAEAANPEWASVPLVGYSACEAIRRVVDAHVVTQVRNRDALLRAGWVEGKDFTAIDSEVVAKPLYELGEAIRRVTGLGWTVTTAFGGLAYYGFEHLVWREFGERITAREFDVVHRVTPLSPTTPSVIGTRCAKVGVPFVWGPINGGVPWPAEFREAQHKEGELLSYVRDAYKLLPGYAGTRSAAKAILVGSKATLADIEPRYRDRCIYLPENAIDPARFSQAVEGPVRSPLRVAWIGRMVPYKGADMLLEAAAGLAREGKLVLDLIGDGPERPALEALVDRLGIRDAVRMDGWIDHKLLQHRLRESDVFAFPSIREFGGGVVLEAMALGLAPIVVGYAGPDELVTDDTGLRIPIGARASVIEGFREALERFVGAPDDVRRFGTKSRERVTRLFTWDAKAAQIAEVYRFVLGRGPKPDFGMPLR